MWTKKGPAESDGAVHAGNVPSAQSEAMVDGWNGCAVHEGAECTMRGKNVVREGGTDVVGCAEEGGSDDDGDTAVGFVACGSTVSVVRVLVPVFAPQLVPSDDLLDVVDGKSV